MFRRLTQFHRRLRGDESGVAALEFALVVPFVILVYMAGYALSEAATVNRKVNDTTVQLANVSAQYTSMSSTDVSNVLTASAQIMTPYSTTPLTIKLTEVLTNGAGAGVVQWTCAYQGACTTTGGNMTMPAGFQTPSTYYIIVQTTYAYTPTIGSNYVGALNMSSQTVMLPRASSSIPYTG